VEPLDLVAVRAVLGPLDLDPVFQVVAGDHLHGFPAPGSLVRIRGCHREALAATPARGRRVPTLELDLLDRGMDLRLTSHDLDRIGEKLVSGEGPLIEAVHSPLVVAGEAEITELRGAVRPLLSRGLHSYYRSLARAARRELEGQLTRKVLPLLRMYRALLGGIQVLESGEVVPDLPRLAEIHEIPYLDAAMARPTKPPWIGDPALLGFLFGEADDLFERLDRAEARSPLPDRPGSDAALREFLQSQR
jgi:predicted nucleotidyltransferase